ncbi:MAG TPA: hypothetical protein VFQ92_14795 [Blastocatellia bacterium]|nr:hypothetical protein [Blastocatellia bacterium]
MNEIIEQVWDLSVSELIRLLAIVIAVGLALALARQKWVARELKKVRRQVEQRIRSYEQR